jgi:hypothetical protein
MEYVDRVVDGRPAWEVVTITLGPDGGRLGELHFRPGDLIVKVGNGEVIPGENLDRLIRLAERDHRRAVTLVEPGTGKLVSYPF